MMMEDIAMHILDIGMNSIQAKASLIEITLQNQKVLEQMHLTFQDNGEGMEPSTLAKALDPFYTTRTTRSIGLGLPFLKAAAELSDGSFQIHSERMVGTTIHAYFSTKSWDCPPIGNLGEAIVNLAMMDEKIDLLFVYCNERGSFVFDTKEIKAELDEIAMSEPSIVIWLKQFINEEIKHLETGGRE